MEASRETVRAFVSGTLGCGCPDGVFDEIEAGVADEAAFGPALRLLIGKRLLVIFIESDDRHVIGARLPALLEYGRGERDAKGYNRLRVVIVSARPRAIRQEAASQFAALASGDERVHLHVLPRDAHWQRLQEAMVTFAVTVNVAKRTP